MSLRQARAISAHVAVVAICTLLIGAQVATAEFTHGVMTSKEGFHYMAKFCYDYTSPPLPGSTDTSTMTLSVSMRAPMMAIPENMRLYVFDDQPNSWPMVYGRDISCGVKISKSRNSTAIRWNVEGQWRMPLARIHEHVRPRFWYIVAANCQGFENVEYNVKFTNQGGEWKQQFGVNEQGLNTLYLVYFILYGIGISIHMYALRDMWSNGTLHPIVKLLSSAILLQFGNIFCSVIHYFTFMADGMGVYALKGLGEVFNISSRLCFMFLLILLAQGWTISTDTIHGRSQIFGTFALCIVAYGLVVLWDVIGRDPASTLYVYQSPPGYLIIFLDIVVGAWFIISIQRSHSEEEDDKKQKFYEMIGFGFSLYFVALPCVVLVAMMLDPWVREITVKTISLTVSTCAYTALALLLWPGRAEEYFKITTPDTFVDSSDGL